MARSAVAAGLPVFVEKPLTLDRGEADDLFNFTCAEVGLVWVEHTHLFHPA
jgi:predicted dehydrogenase